MQAIEISEIKREVQNLLLKASFNLPQDIVEAIKNARSKETGLVARKILDLILENEEIARQQKLPLCQDCGTVYINLDIGPDICIKNSACIIDSINQAVAEVYKKYYLRKSIVSDPLYDRKNTSSNTPAIIDICFSSKACFSGLSIEVNIKGGGSENCSYLFMATPSVDEEDIADMILDIVKKNVTKCCPPVIIGVGIGSTASEVTKLARKASFRNLKIRSSDVRYRRLEEKILEEVNKSGIGPQGLGGKSTALACNIEFAPCHMATLPVAVFLGCHSVRRASSNILQN